MKRSDYFYTFLLLGMLALIIYGFQNYFWIMFSLIAFSSVFNFVMFIIQTRLKLPIAGENYADEPIDFYKADTRTTYYIDEKRKKVNGE